MNCLECRRRLLIEPTDRRADLLEHLAECGKCAHEAEKALAFEDKLRYALGVDVPRGLESRVLLARNFTQPRRNTAVMRWAVAACLALSLSLAGWLNVSLFRDDAGSGLQLGEVVLEHIRSESQYLLKDEHVQHGALSHLLSSLGGKVTGNIGSVRYAGHCRIRGETGIHLVLAGDKGPVTVLLMPGERIDQSSIVESGELTGVLLPTNYGSMAVVGERDEPFGLLAERVKNSVSWEI